MYYINPSADLVLILVLSIIGITIIVARNPHKNHLTPVSLSAFGLIVSDLVFFNVNVISGHVLWTISAIGLFIFYSLRFKSKKQKLVLDYLKLIGVLLLIIYPISFYSLVSVWESMLWDILRFFTLPLLALLLIYDRFVLTPQPMKKKHLIIIIAQSVLLVMFFIFASVQMMEANRQQEMAQRNLEMAENCERQARQMENQAREMEKIAREMRQQAIIERDQALKAYEDAQRAKAKVSKK